MSSAPGPSGSDPHLAAEQLRADLNDRLAASSSSASSSPGHADHSVTDHVHVASHSTSSDSTIAMPAPEPVSTTISAPASSSSGHSDHSVSDPARVASHPTPSSASVSPPGSSEGRRINPIVAGVIAIVLLATAGILFFVLPEKSSPNAMNDGPSRDRQTEKSAQGDAKSSPSAKVETAEAKSTGTSEVESSASTPSQSSEMSGSAPEPAIVAEKLDDQPAGQTDQGAAPDMSAAESADQYDWADRVIESIDKYGHIESRFTPVIVYRRDESDIPKSGGLLYGDSGPVFTLESLLHRSSGFRKYGYRILWPLSENMSGDILQVQAVGAELGNFAEGSNPNVVALAIGQPGLIEGFSTKESLAYESLAYKKCAGPTLNHLVSGKEAKMIGEGKSREDQMSYWIIEYDLIHPGETGSGFVDRKTDDAYLLIGMFKPFDGQFEKKLDTTKNLAVVVGPIRY